MWSLYVQWEHRYAIKPSFPPANGKNIVIDRLTLFQPPGTISLSYGAYARAVIRSPSYEAHQSKGSAVRPLCTCTTFKSPDQCPFINQSFRGWYLSFSSHCMCDHHNIITVGTRKSWRGSDRYEDIETWNSIRNTRCTFKKLWTIYTCWDLRVIKLRKLDRSKDRRRTLKDWWWWLSWMHTNHLACLRMWLFSTSHPPCTQSQSFVHHSRGFLPLSRFVLTFRRWHITSVGAIKRKKQWRFAWMPHLTYLAEKVLRLTSERIALWWAGCLHVPQSTFFRPGHYGRCGGRG